MKRLTSIAILAIAVTVGVMAYRIGFRHGVAYALEDHALNLWLYELNAITPRRESPGPAPAVVSARLRGRESGDPIVLTGPAARQLRAKFQGLKHPRSYEARSDVTYGGVLGWRDDAVSFIYEDGAEACVWIGQNWSVWELTPGATGHNGAVVVHGPVASNLQSVVEQIRQDAQPENGTRLQ